MGIPARAFGISRHLNLRPEKRPESNSLIPEDYVGELHKLIENGMVAPHD